MSIGGKKLRSSTSFVAPQAKNDETNKRRSFSSIEKSLKSDTDKLFKTLMQDPIKRALALQIILSQQEKGALVEGESSEGKIKTPVKRLKKKIRYESPTSLFRRKQLQANYNKEPTSHQRLRRSSTMGEKISHKDLLAGLVFYVEVRAKGEDRSAAIKMLVQSMGAVVQDDFSKKVTHVIFKDGSYDTYQKAKFMKIHLVSLLWLEAVRINGKRVPEKDYPALGVDKGDASILCEQMEKDYNEMINEELDRTNQNTRRKLLDDELDDDDLNGLNNSLELPASDTSSHKSLEDSPDIVSSSSDNSNCGIINGNCVKNLKSAFAEINEALEQVSNLTKESNDTSSSLLLMNKSNGKSIQGKVSAANCREEDMELTSNISSITAEKVSDMIVSSAAESDKMAALRLSTDESTNVSDEQKVSNKRKSSTTSSTETPPQSKNRKLMPDSAFVTFRNSNNKINNKEKLGKLDEEKSQNNIKRKLYDPDNSDLLSSLEESTSVNEISVSGFKKPLLVTPSVKKVLERRKSRIEENSKTEGRKILQENNSDACDNSDISGADTRQTNKTPKPTQSQRSPQKIPSNGTGTQTQSKRRTCLPKKYFALESDFSNSESSSIQNIYSMPKRQSARLSQANKNKKENESPHFSRRSTLEFQTASQMSSKKPLTQGIKKLPSIVCTRLHNPDVQIFTQIASKLGGFVIEDEVSSRTTHVVAGENKRTINILRALIRGCWILKHEWLLKSLENGKWLPEEPYEMLEFSPAVQHCRRERQAFGKNYSIDIFSNCGPIYVYKGSIPRCSDLKELVQLCKGRITTILRNASIVVGEFVDGVNHVCVKETWILDSISNNKRKSFKNYLIKQ